MLKFKWLPIFKMQLPIGCLLIFKRDYRKLKTKLKPYFYKNEYNKDLTFGFMNIEIQYRELADVKYNCHICLYDPADCSKEIRRHGNNALLECYNISMKDGNMVEN